MKTFSRFLFVGFLNTGWGYFLIFLFMYAFKWSPETSNIAGYGIGIVTSYALNRTFTFGSNNKKLLEIPMLFVVFAIAYSANFLTLSIMIHLLGFSNALSQIIAGSMYVAVSYTMYRKYVFRTGQESRSGKTGQ